MKRQLENEVFHLQQITENCRHQAEVLAITSGKGGVGKTNMAAKLSNGSAAQPNKEGFFIKLLTASFLKLSAEESIRDWTSALSVCTAGEQDAKKNACVYRT